MKKLLPLASFIILSYSAGFLGTLLSGDQSFAVYQVLKQPSFAPPSWVFGPVWSILYLMMGVSAFLIWQEKKNPNRQKALSLFYIQLFLNMSWSPLFFGMGERISAFFVIIALWIFILLNIIFFLRIKKLAAYLLIPYLLWVSFAAVLNFAIWKINF